MEKDYLLVTGASSGIGAEVACALSYQYNVILNGRDIERLKEVKARCQEGTHLIWHFDLSDIEKVESNLCDFIEQNRIPIRYFVHCAGVMKQTSVRMLKPSYFHESFNVNVVSAAIIIKILVSKRWNDKALKSAVLVSSINAEYGAKSFSVYGASKAAVNGLVKSLAIELAPLTRVNSILPGGIHTRMTNKIYDEAKDVEQIESVYPLGGGTVTDIRNIIDFLLSNKARWITGQGFIVDGGRTVNITV